MTVTLRPVRADDDEYLDHPLDPATDPFNFFGFPPAGRRRQQFAADGLLTPDAGSLLVEADGVVVGDVSYRSEHFGPFGWSRAFDIGISLRPAHRRRGYGSAAQRLLADYLFGITAANRVSASTDVENIAEQRALERAGFTREGLVRGAQFRAGAWHDLVSYSRLRTDS